MSFKIRPETAEDDYAINQIIQNVFGPGRFAKTAYRMRETYNNHTLFGLVTENHLGRIVATIRVSLLDKVHENIGFLGPIAVDEALQNMGLGMALMQEALLFARTSQLNHILLVGDPEYYKRFGFIPLMNSHLAHKIHIPHPINMHRVLIYTLDVCLVKH